MSDELQQKPDWDKSKRGVHPAFTAPVTDEEITAWKRDKMRLAAGEGRKYLSAESIFYADNEQAKKDNFLRLTEALKEPNNVDAISAYRFGLAAAAANLSLFDYALQTISDSKGQALPGFDELAKRIKRLKAAEAQEDGAECHCQRVKKTITVTSTIGSASASKEHEVEEQRRQRVGMIYSSRQNAVRHVYECRHCGHLGLHEKAPESHQEAITARRQHEGRFKHASEFDVKEMGHLADQVLLKPIEKPASP